MAQNNCVTFSKQYHTLEGIHGLCPLDNGRHDPRPKYSLGKLDRLPLELVESMLVHLDLRTLTDFRRVNQRAMQVVNWIPEYKATIHHAALSLRGILSIGTARWITCQDLYARLCTAECETCGDFGGFLYLLTCRRVCYQCFTRKPSYLPILREAAKRKFGLSCHTMFSLPSMTAIPGRYSPFETRVSRLILLDHDTAQQAGIALHGSESAMEQYAAEVLSTKLEKFQGRVDMANRTQSQKRSRAPRTVDEWDAQTTNPKRFVAIVHAPFLDKRTQRLEWGFDCTACRELDQRRDESDWPKLFSEDSFKTHLAERGKIVVSGRYGRFGNHVH